MTDRFKAFNKSLKELIDIISNEIPDEPLMETVNRKYKAAVLTDRTILLTELGKELFVFRDYIADNKWDELINRDWETEAQQKAVELGGQHNSISSMIRILRNIWSRYDSDEKSKVKKLIKTMLKSYTLHLMA